MTYTLQVRSSEKFKDQNKCSAKYKQKHTIMQANTHIYHKMQSHNLKSQTGSKSCSRWTKRHIKWQDVQHTKHHWSTSRTPIYSNTRKTQNSITDQNIMNTNLSKHKKTTEQHHWSTTSWTPIYPNTAKTQNNITDQKQCKHQSTDMQEKTQNNITDQLHHEHQFIQMQEKQGIASLIDCIMNTNLSWSTTSWTPIYSNAGKTGNSIVDWLHHEHQSFLINYIMNTNLSKCRKNKE